MTYTLKKLFMCIFFECGQAIYVWSWALTILNRLRYNLSSFYPWVRLSIGACLFNENLLKKIEQFKNVRWCLRSLMLWTIWIDHNNKIFKLRRPRDHQVRYWVWQGMIDYARIEWRHTLNLISHVTTTRWNWNMVLFIIGYSSLAPPKK